MILHFSVYSLVASLSFIIKDTKNVSKSNIWIVKNQKVTDQNHLLLKYFKILKIFKNIIPYLYQLFPCKTCSENCKYNPVFNFFLYF